MDLIAAFLRDGGTFIYLIILVSLIGFAIILERVTSLIFKYPIDAKSLWNGISKSVQAGEMNKARAMCKDNPAPLARLIHRGLNSHDQDPDSVQNAIDEATLEIIPDIEKRTPYLAMLANVSTMLGLLGTIHGLIQAFSAVGTADPSQKAALLASGISIALYTTASGLIVAIPILIMYSILQSKTHRLVDELDEYAIKLLNLLSSKK